jgi:ribosome recycling factor
MDALKNKVKNNLNKANTLNNNEDDKVESIRKVRSKESDNISISPGNIYISPDEIKDMIEDTKKWQDKYCK